MMPFYAKLRPFNSILFTLLQSYMFQPTRGYPQGVLMHSVSEVNKICVQM